MLMRDAEGRKKEESKAIQTTKPSNTTHQRKHVHVHSYLYLTFSCRHDSDVAAGTSRRPRGLEAHSAETDGPQCLRTDPLYVHVRGGVVWGDTRTSR